MPKAKFKFFPVGQGLFHAAKIYINESDSFTFIYDCGSFQTKCLLQSIDDCINFFNEEKHSENIRKIDFLFVSHLHYDHINGIRPLIDKLSQAHIKISNVILPYVNLYQRVILLLDALTHNEQSKDKSHFKNNASYSDGDYIDFYRNPYKHLNKIFLQNDYRQDELPVFYIVNAPSDCFISDRRNSSDKENIVDTIINEDGQTNVSPQADVPELNSFDDNYKIFLTFGERNKDSKDNRSDFDFILNDFYSETENFYEKQNSYHQRKRVEIKVVNDSFEIFVKNIWRFICFNSPLPSDKKVYVKSLYHEYLTITKANGFKIEDIFLKANLDLLKTHYSKLSSDLNSTSLLIYHFPLDCEKHDASHNICSSLRKYSAFLLLGDVNLNSYVTYKSTNKYKKIFLKYLFEKLLPFQDKAHLRGFHLFEKRDEIPCDCSVNYVLAPHHGSDFSWNDNIFYFLNYFNATSFYVVSSSINGKKHPGRDFLCSFLKAFVVPKDDILSGALGIRFLPYSSSVCEFLQFLRGKNVLKWCNEEQYFEIDLERIQGQSQSKSF